MVFPSMGAEVMKRIPPNHLYSQISVKAGERVGLAKDVWAAVAACRIAGRRVKSIDAGRRSTEKTSLLATNSDLRAWTCQIPRLGS
jgi:hypothetical protein